MLPQLYRDRYQQFSTTLKHLQQTVDHVEGTTLRQQFEQVQQFFVEQILCLDRDILAPTAVSRVQSYLTEIDKQLRLLGIDVMFLQAARQSTNQTQRRSQIRLRLQSLIGYCQGVLALENG